MSILSLIIVLLLEQAQPQARRETVSSSLAAYAGFFERHFNGELASHGAVAWLLAVVPATLACAGVYFLLMTLNPLLGLVWNLAILYLTLGFRQFSHFYTDIHLALRMGELQRARELLGQWRGRSADDLDSSTIARLAMEEALVASHRHVFGVMFCFVVLPGPSGAVLYRLSQFLAQHWARRSATAVFGAFAQKAFAWIDWLPARITASAFAVVGDFEDAIYCWRTQAKHWPDEAAGILLASGAGAMGVRLGMPVIESGEVTERPELGLGEEADTESMQGGIGLVWRTLVLCLLVLALMTLASWAG